MKLKKLLLALLAITALSPAAWAELPTDGEYLVQNVETGYYLGGGNDWGTHASLLGKPQWFALTAVGSGAYTLNSHQHNSASAHFLGTGLYVDAASADWTFTENEDGTFKISNNGNYLSGNGKNAALTTVTDADAASAQWKLITKADLVASQENASGDNPVDVTGFILNPEFKRNANTSYFPTWTVTGFNGTGKPSNYSEGQGGNVANIAESYHSTNGFAYSQEINGLKAGYYYLSAQAFYREDGSQTVYPYIFANDRKATFLIHTGEGNMVEAYQSFLAGKYPVGTYVRVAADETLTVGVKGEATDKWNIWGEFGLTYSGTEIPDVETKYAEAEKKIAEIKDSPMNKEVKAKVNKYSSNTSGVTKSEMSDLWYDADILIEEAKASIEVYKQINAYKEEVAKYTDNLDADGTAYYNTVLSKISNGDYETLDEYKEDYLKAVKSQTTSGSDLTGVISSWTITGFDGTGTPSNHAEGISGTDANISESYHSTNGFAYSQVITDLKAGYYSLSTHAFYREDGSTAKYPYIFANDRTTTLPLRTGTENSMAAANESFVAGNYPVSTYVRIEDGASMTIGVKGEATDKWNIWGAFGLTYLGTEIPEIVDELKNSPMNKDVKVELNRLAASDAKLTDLWYDGDSVVTKAKASIEVYKQINAYKEEVAKYTDNLDADGTAYYETVLAKISNGDYETLDEYKEDYLKAVKSQTTIGSDWTGVISNPDFLTNDLSGWTVEGATPTVDETNHDCEFYMLKFDMKQTITGLKKGTYEVSMQAFQRLGFAGTTMIDNYLNGSWESKVSLYTSAEESAVKNICEDAQSQRLYTVSGWTTDSEMTASDGNTYYVPNSMAGARVWFDKGYYTTTARATVLEDGGELYFGFKGDMTASGHWIIFDNFKLKYIDTEPLIKAEEVQKLYDRIPTTPFNAELKDQIESTKTLIEGDKVGTEYYNGRYYSTLQSLVGEAETSAANYVAVLETIEKVEDIVSKTNVYTNDAYKTITERNAKMKTAYTDGTLDEEEAASYKTDVFGTGAWHADNTIDDLLLSAWGTTDYNSDLYINTWSTEGDGDGTDFVTPFYEYWTSGNSLAAKTLTGALSGQEGNFVKVTAWVRVQAKNGNPTGVTLNLNDGVAVNVCGEPVGSNNLYIGEFSTIGQIKNGRVAINFVVASNNNVSWLSFKNVMVEPATDEEASAFIRNNLKEEIDSVKNYYATAQYGSGLFEKSKSLHDVLKRCITAAETALENGTLDELQTAESNLMSTYEYCLVAPLNAPDYNQAYKLSLADNGKWTYDGKAITSVAGSNTTGGYGLSYIDKNKNYAQAFFFEAVDEDNNDYKLKFVDAEGADRYLCTGVVYGGTAAQIRTTTEADKALVIRVERNGEYLKLRNTEAAGYLGSQDAGVFTTNHNNFNIETTDAKNTVSVTFAQPYATVVLPFSQAAAEAKVSAYNVTGVKGRYVAVEPVDTLKYGKAYLIAGNEGDTYTFSGVNVANTPAAAEGLLVGSYEGTNAAAGAYTLSTEASEFRQVSEETPVAAYNAYLSIEGVEANALPIEIFNTADLLQGDADNDAEVSINDYSYIKYIILERADLVTVPELGSSAFYRADANGDDAIDAADAATIVNKVLGIEPTETSARRVASIADATESVTAMVTAAEGETVRLAVVLDNVRSYTAAQFDVVLPKGVKVVGQSLTDRTAALELAGNVLNNGNLRVLLSSASNKVIEGINGAIVYVDLKVSTSYTGDPVELTNVVLADTKGNAYRLSAAGEATGIEGVSAATDNHAAIYSVDGKAQQSLKSGVNITIDKSGVARKVIRK
jgi:hypothetical protein